VKTIASVLLACAAYGQTISGRITDAQESAIPAAQVSLLARDNTVVLRTTAGMEGRYLLERVPPGSYLLAVEATGFGSGERAVAVASGSRATHDFRLQVAGVQTSVVVTAATTPQTTDEISKAVSIVDGAAISASHVAEALRQLPGLRVQRLGGPGASTAIVTRGLRNEDTAVLIDGFRVRDATASRGDASGLLEDLAATDIDRVEVLRGAGSSLYGSNAIGGVVNIITGEGGGPTHGSLLAEGGGLGAFRGRAQVAGAVKRLRYSAGLAHLNVTRGIEGHDPARNHSAQSRVDYILTPKVRLFGRIFAADSYTRLRSSAETAPGAPAGGIVEANPSTFIAAAPNPDYARTARIFSGALTLTARPTASLGITASYHALTSRRRFSDGPAGTGSQPETSGFTRYLGDIHTGGLRADWRLGSHHALDAGYEFERESYRDRSSMNSAVSAAQHSHSVYAQDQVRLLAGRLQLAASWRAQFFTLERPAFTPAASAPYAQGGFPAPPTAQTGDTSAAYFLRSTGTKLRMHAGRGYRAPSLYERFGSYYSAYGYSVYGDPRLRPDRSLAMDAGLDQALWNNRARLSATWFYTCLQEVIVFDASGAITPTMDPFGRYGGYRNTNGGLARGVELSAAVNPSRDLSATAAYTYTNARDRTPWADGVVRTYVIPDHQLALSVTERMGPRLTLICSLLASSNYLTPLFDPRTYSSRAYRFGGMRQVQAGASYRVPLREARAMRFFVRGENVFGQTYFENGFRTPGATAQGGLQFEF